jgi:hypothetical protein
MSEQDDYNLIEELQEWLKIEPKVGELLDVTTTFTMRKILNKIGREISFIPITHNDDVVFLQFCGWSINLYKDGTWMIEDTIRG